MFRGCTIKEMKRKTTPLLVLLVLALAPTPTLAQTQMVHVGVLSTSIHECRRDQSERYDVYVGGHFQVENRSDSAILLPKRVDVVRSVAVALSPTDARDRKYVFVMDQEFGANGKNAKPRISDFIVIRPQEKRTAKILATAIPATADPNDNAHEQFRPGKYWLQLEFLPLPNSFPSGDKELPIWQERWKSSGLLLRSYILTEPFPVEIVLSPNAPKCGS